MKNAARTIKFSKDITKEILKKKDSEFYSKFNFGFQLKNETWKSER
jgi:hypothetical protein